MTAHTPDLFDYARSRALTVPAGDSPKPLPATEKQLKYAKLLAQKAGATLPWEIQSDRKRLSDWIDRQQKRRAERSDFSNYPSSKQVGFAERIARIKRTQVPPECFRDRYRMSRWIDANR